MFESNRFQSDYYAQQRDFVTMFVLFVIAFSIIYFCVVFMSEVTAVFCPNGCSRGKGKGKGKSSSKSGAGGKKGFQTMGDGSDEDQETSRRGSAIAGACTWLCVQVYPPPLGPD